MLKGTRVKDSENRRQNGAEIRGETGVKFIKEKNESKDEWAQKASRRPPERNKDTRDWEEKRGGDNDFPGWRKALTGLILKGSNNSS